MAQLADKFVAVTAMLDARFQERRGVIESMVCAALAGEHVLLLGPPGTAKSALARGFCSEIQGSQYFEWLLSKFTAPEELFGPLSLAGLKADTFRRVTTGKLPEAHVVFLDEIFKANSGVLNSLLTAINERLFHNGPEPVALPLRMLVGASNELPEGPELAALYDRFLVRHWVQRIQLPDAFFAMLTGEEHGAAQTLTLADWDTAQAEVAKVELPKATQQAFWTLRAQLEKEAGITPSDRRMKRAVKLVKANAWLSGETEAAEEHMGVLADVFWEQPEQREPVAKVVGSLSSGAAGEALKIQDVVLQLIAGLPANGRSGDQEYQNMLVACNKEGNQAIRKLRHLADQQRSPAKKLKIERMVSKLEGALGPVRESARQALGL